MQLVWSYWGSFNGQNLSNCNRKKVDWLAFLEEWKVEMIKIVVLLRSLGKGCKADFLTND